MFNKGDVFCLFFSLLAFKWYFDRSWADRIHGERCCNIIRYPLYSPCLEVFSIIPTGVHFIVILLWSIFSQRFGGPVSLVSHLQQLNISQMKWMWWLKLIRIFISVLLGKLYMGFIAFAQFKGARAVDRDRASGLYNHREYPNSILRYKTCQLKCKAGSLAWALISQREKNRWGHLSPRGCLLWYSLAINLPPVFKETILSLWNIFYQCTSCRLCLIHWLSVFNCFSNLCVIK